MIIRVRRIASRAPLVRRYEIQLLSASTNGALISNVLRRGFAVRFLESEFGLGDAWTFVSEADKVWLSGERGWAVDLDWISPS